MTPFEEYAAFEKYTRDVVDSLVQDIIDVYDISIPICVKWYRPKVKNDIFDVVKKFGGRIEEIEDYNCYGSSRVRKEGDGFVIEVSKYIVHEKQNWLIARALGELFLCMGYRINDKLWNSYKDGVWFNPSNADVSVRQMMNANYFASAFLMPKVEYLRIVKRYTVNGEVDMAKVAEYFDVPRRYAQNRGHRLGCIKTNDIDI